MKIPKMFDPRYWIRVWQSGAFDRANGTDTRFSRKSDEKQTVASHLGDSFGHTTIKDVELLERALASCPLPIEDCTFVDIGCGKGRPLLEALLFPFRMVWGVEIAPDLARIAQSNIDTLKRRRRIPTPATVICGDAALCDLPAGNLVVLLNQPFGEATTRIVAQRLWAHDGAVALLYVKPTFAGAVDAIFPSCEWPANSGARGWLRK